MLKLFCRRGHPRSESYRSPAGRLVCRTCAKATHVRWGIENGAASNASHNKYHRKQRKAAIAFLGGSCVRCGFSDYRALQIDHINGGGKQEHDLAGGRIGLWNRVLAGDSRYQLLCANCNCIKRVENREYKPRPITRYEPADQKETEKLEEANNGGN